MEVPHLQASRDAPKCPTTPLPQSQLNANHNPDQQTAQSNVQSESITPNTDAIFFFTTGRVFFSLQVGLVKDDQHQYSLFSATETL